MNIEQSLNKLFSLHQFGIKLGLEKSRKLLAHIGNPQDELKCFHVAGSNAKGSVSSFISSILTEDGNKVGLYTSPHFVKFNERIRINGKMIDDDYVMEFMNELDDYINENEPTFFELTTAMAFKYFKENNVDYAVIETGLGGRLDSTNVVDPIASIITTISLEHTNILGNTLEEIAFEKGEIIKPNRKVIVGMLPTEAENVIVKKAKSVSAELHNLKESIDINPDSVTITGDEKTFKIYNTPLFGSYQLKNAALAFFALSKCNVIKETDSIYKGIKNVIENTGIQGRFESYSDIPKIIFDSSHNEEGISNFIKEFKNESVNYDNKEVIFGVMKDKDIKKMLVQFDNLFDKIFITTFEYDRAASIEQIEIIAEENNINVFPLENPDVYIREFRKKGVNECLVVLGSIYLLGQIKTKLLYEKT